jgi:hypothetical protein
VVQGCNCALAAPGEHLGDRGGLHAGQVGQWRLLGADVVEMDSILEVHSILEVVRQGQVRQRLGVVVPGCEGGTQQWWRQTKTQSWQALAGHGRTQQTSLPLAAVGS